MAFAHLSPLAFAFLSENLPPWGAVPQPTVGLTAAQLLLGAGGAAPRLSRALTPVVPSWADADKAHTQAGTKDLCRHGSQPIVGEALGPPLTPGK